MKMRTPCYVFDIDGTLADCSHRLHHIKKAEADWTAFYAGVQHDTPIPHAIQLANDLGETTEIFFLSGRSDECQSATVAWLAEHLGGWDIKPQDVYMRKTGDHRDDAIVKIELLERLRSDGFEPLMIFEDRTRVVDAFRAAGIPCAQIAPGDF